MLLARACRYRRRFHITPWPTVYGYFAAWRDDGTLGRLVSEVAVSPDRVRVVTADCAVEEGSHVVVTVPLGVLKRGLPRFSARPCYPPPLIWVGFIMRART